MRELRMLVGMSSEGECGKEEDCDREEDDGEREGYNFPGGQLFLVCEKPY